MARRTVAIVVTGGDRPEAGHLALLGVDPADAVVVAADSGVAHARALGLVVDVAVGDFDSLAPSVLAAAEAEGAEVQRHPAAKDATDLELALDTARAAGVERIVVLGGHGGRLDHFLANVSVLAAPALSDVRVDAVVGDAVISVLRPAREVRFRGRPGELVSVLPIHGPAEGVVTEGLRYPLHAETLPVGTTRGVSNEVVAEEAAVSLAAGVALVVRPGPPL